MVEGVLQVQHVSKLRSLEDPEVHKRICKILPLELIMRQTVAVLTICFEIHFNIVLSFLSIYVVYIPIFLRYLQFTV